MDKTIVIEDITIDELQVLIGVNNTFLKVIEDYFETEVILIHNEIFVKDAQYKDMIERGEDENGRKFYKLFFDEES